MPEPRGVGRAKIASEGVVVAEKMGAGFEKKAQIMDSQAMARAITRISHEIIEKNKGADGLVLVGVRRRGYPLAQRIAERIREIEGVSIMPEPLDVGFYRDDVEHTEEDSRDRIGASLDGATVVLIDDVICTGRTVRAAIDALFSSGRPRAVQLAVLVDRGLRELPFRPDYVGKNIPTSHAERVFVSVAEIDGEDGVIIAQDKSRSH